MSVTNRHQHVFFPQRPVSPAASPRARSDGRKDWLFTAIPLLFALYQFTDGAVWLALDSDDARGGLRRRGGSEAVRHGGCGGFAWMLKGRFGAT